jgi:uncharacterized protein
MMAGGCATITIEPKYPSPTGYVVDGSALIQDLDKTKIEYMILELKRKTTVEVAVVTVDSTEPLTIEKYAINLFNRFGIGQKGNDNGVLLLVAYKDHRMRIEVGHGLMGVLTDEKCSEIINRIMVPEFQAGRLSQGILDATWVIVSIISRKKE